MSFNCVYHLACTKQKFESLFSKNPNNLGVFYWMRGDEFISVTFCYIPQVGTQELHEGLPTFESMMIPVKTCCVKTPFENLYKVLTGHDITIFLFCVCLSIVNKSCITIRET